MNFDEIKFHDITKKYVDCPCLQDNTSDGFDCWTMIIDFYESMGINTKDWKLGESLEEFRSNLMSLGNNVEKNFMCRGDLIIFKGRLIGPAIYIGNSNAITIWDTGGKVFSLKGMEYQILGIRRLM